MKPVNTQLAIQYLEKVSNEHLAWLKQIHCALMFHCIPLRPLDALPQAVEDWVGTALEGGIPHGRRQAWNRLKAAHRRLDKHVEALRLVSLKGGRIEAGDYLAFMGSVEGYQAALRDLQALARQILAETDPLTSVRNRQGMMRDLRREWTRAMRTGQPCCIALADIDFFKNVNDTYGHRAGDKVLSLAARFFMRRLRPYDMVYRYGGEEFLFCLPNTDAATARRVLDRLRGLMGRLPVTFEDGRRTTITVSIGVCQLDPGSSVEESIETADQMLYSAKRSGRNCVRVAGPTEELDSLNCRLRAQNGRALHQ
ncbi:diguanylate cyclase [Telmatospirillum sp. J64-1]|uniref:diguanylate cyclase n=1 Tax=Telmatospirillum sp. J64-1 TaxID=2502183 RepID=UPI00163DE65B|nr:diguanylate cyclase [Telmatospirillum sp. J64-1]